MSGGNICIGWRAGWSLTTGGGNILLGKNAGAKLTTESNVLEIRLGNFTYRGRARWWQRRLVLWFLPLMAQIFTAECGDERKPNIN